MIIPVMSTRMRRPFFMVRLIIQDLTMRIRDRGRMPLIDLRAAPGPGLDPV